MKKNKTQTISKKPKSLKLNSIYYGLYTILNVLFPFLTGVYVARILMPESIGIVASAQNIAQYFVIFAYLGIPTYALREIPKVKNDREAFNKLFSELFFINFISTIFFLLVYTTLIMSIGALREQLYLYLIVGGSIALNALNIDWMYEGLEEFKFISVRSVLFKIIIFVLLIIFIRNPDDYLIYAALTVCGVAGNYVINVLFANRYTKLVFKGLSFRRHLKPILFLVAVNLAIEVYSMVDTTMLTFMKDSKTVAFYSYGMKISRIGAQVVNLFTMVIVPRLSALYKDNKKEEFNSLLSKGLEVVLLIAIPMVIGIIFTANFLITFIYGEQYSPSAYVVMILAPIWLISSLGYLLGSRVLLVTGNENKMLICVASGALVNVILNFVLIPGLGERGAAIASLIGEFVIMIIYVFRGRQYFKINNFGRYFYKILISNLVVLGYLLIMHFIPFNFGWARCLAQIFGSIFLYAIILILLKEPMISDVINNKILKNRSK